MRTNLILAVALLGASYAHAEQPSAALQVELQTAMLTYTESLLVDGGYTYIDTNSDALKTVYPANIHPFIVQLGEDFVVCSEMVDDAGNSVTADYVVRSIDGKYRVVQMLVNDRDSLQGAMSKLGK